VEAAQLTPSPLTGHSLLNPNPNPNPNLSYCKNIRIKCGRGTADISTVNWAQTF